MDQERPSFLPASAVVNAAVASTEKYLAFLDAKGTETTHKVAGIARNEEAPAVLIDSARWCAFTCVAPPRLRLPADSGATFVGHEAPGKAREIRIIEYDRRTGYLYFAAREPITSKEGHIGIDFRWLVRQTLEWLQQRGRSVKPIDAVAARKSTYDITEPSGISPEQADALRAILSSSLCYVWGPPGTGKTQWVLAKAVRNCVQHGERVLVLASTNLAVDNALAAVIKDGVAAADVIRIGLPTPAFIERFPESCQERAFRHEMRQIQSQVAALTLLISSEERREDLEGQIARLNDETAALTHQLENDGRSLAVAERACSEAQESLGEFLSTQQKRAEESASCRAEIDSLALPELSAQIEVLETEQARTIKELELTRRQHRDLGFMARTFTSRKKSLEAAVSRHEEHLRSTETTLESRRARYREVAPRIAALEKGLQRLATESEEAAKQVAQTKRACSEHQSQIRQRKEALAKGITRRATLGDKRKGASEALGMLRQSHPPAHSANLLERWREQKIDLLAQLEQFKPDLATKAVLGATLDGFIGMTLSQGLQVDRVIIDEAPYAPLAKVLPLLSLGCPIAMLGDHFQLPPVTECDSDPIVCSYWSKPAIFLEDAFRVGNEHLTLHKQECPCLVLTERRVLTVSYRYGNSLASLLDSHIYGRIGLVGKADQDTSIRCIHCEPRNEPGRKKHENHAEVEAILGHIAMWWEWRQRQPDEPTIGVLTPYKVQAALLRKQIAERFADPEIADHVEVWNTHQAQGREWDWVLCSIADTANLPGGNQFLTGTESDKARRVLNTTISRAKRHLRLFLDANYWHQRQPRSLLTEIVTQHPPQRSGRDASV